MKRWPGEAINQKQANKTENEANGARDLYAEFFDRLVKIGQNYLTCD